jgi:hypothetical protein
MRITHYRHQVSNTDPVDSFEPSRILGVSIRCTATSTIGLTYQVRIHIVYFNGLMQVHCAGNSGGSWNESVKQFRAAACGACSPDIRRSLTGSGWGGCLRPSPNRGRHTWVNNRSQINSSTLELC